MREIWKQIKGFEGLYEVSSFGKVKRTEHFSPNRWGGSKHYPEQMKKLGFDKDGYRTVMLYKGTQKKLCKVHRLVAEAFIDNPNNLPFVNHKDENPGNNHTDNLEWCDCSYNNNYGNRNQKMSETKKHAHRCYAEKGSDGRFIKKDRGVL